MSSSLLFNLLESISREIKIYSRFLYFDSLRAASWRICSLVFYQALGLRLASVSGTPLSFTLARQAKLDASCRVKVPVGQGLANHPYRVLRVRRSVASGFDCYKCEQGRRSVHRDPHRPQGIRTSLKPGQHRYSINTDGDVVNVTEANIRKSPRRDF